MRIWGVATSGERGAVMTNHVMRNVHSEVIAEATSRPQGFVSEHCQLGASALFCLRSLSNSPRHDEAIRPWRPRIPGRLGVCGRRNRARRLQTPHYLDRSAVARSRLPKRPCYWTKRQLGSSIGSTGAGGGRRGDFLPEPDRLHHHLNAVGNTACHPRQLRQGGLPCSDREHTEKVLMDRSCGARLTKPSHRNVAVPKKI